MVGQAFGDSTEGRLAVGETPNLAARLQNCRPDEVVIAAVRAPCWQRVRSDRPGLVQKGISEPVQTWRGSPGARRAFGATHEERRSPVVGREDETARLLNVATRTRRAGQVVLVGGEPGSGVATHPVLLVPATELHRAAASVFALLT